MKADQVLSLTETFEGHAQQAGDGVEYWLARDLQQLLGYTQWRNFLNSVSKAKTACEVSGHQVPESYATTLQEIKTHLRNARVRAVLAANPIVIEAYWQTGKIILARQKEAAWGAKVIDRLAADLREAFPDMGGLTRRNLFSMRAFAESFPDGPIVKQLVSH